MSFLVSQDQKKLQGQFIAEPDTLFGSKLRPMRQKNAKKGVRLSCGGSGATGNRRLPLGGAAQTTPKSDLHSIRTTPSNRDRMVLALCSMVIFFKGNKIFINKGCSMVNS